jgi:hypothetical protein
MTDEKSGACGEIPYYKGGGWQSYDQKKPGISRSRTYKFTIFGCATIS